MVRSGRSHTYKGHRIEGDPNMPKTRWWNRYFLRKLVWKKLVVFKVPEGSIYTVGYRDFLGELQIIEWRPLDDPFFAVLVGHEDSVFIALGIDGKEIQLSVKEITTISHIDDTTPLL